MKQLKPIALFLLLSIFFSAQAGPIKVACVGNSITYGSGVVNRDKNSYPAQLQYYLGDKYKVENFGVSATTLLSKGDHPYIQTQAYKDALAFSADIIFIKLGTNDSKPQNIKYIDEFTSDYQSIIDSFRQHNKRARIILLTPTASFLPPESTINDNRIMRYIAPAIMRIAEQNGLEVIDMHPLFPSCDLALMPDRLHPSSIGAGIIAKHLFKYLNGTKSGKRICYATLAVPGNEYRSAAGWQEGADWHSVSEEISSLAASSSNIDLLLLGNSITQGFGGERSLVTYKPGLEPLNQALAGKTWISAAISGDRTQNLLWRIKNGGYERCHPKNIIITIGVNNLGTDTPEDIAAGILSIASTAKVKMPDSHIILLGLLPTGADGSSQRKAYYRIHDILSHTPVAGVKYINPTEWFVESGDKINSSYLTSDMVHLTADGYRMWSQKIAELIK